MVIGWEKIEWEIKVSSVKEFEMILNYVENAGYFFETYLDGKNR